METIYCTTDNFIRHRGNVVDLSEYRRKLALAQSGSLAPKPREARVEPTVRLWEAAPRRREEQEEQEEHPRRRTRRARRLSWLADIWASLSVVAVTAAFTLELLLT